MKTIALLLTTALIASSSAYAGKCSGGVCPKKAKAERNARKMEREAERDALKAYMAPKDKNKDGSLSKDEFVNGEGDKSAAERRFDEANKNGDRYLSKTEILAIIDVPKAGKKKKKK